jgi:hypothetical protein
MRRLIRIRSLQFRLIFVVVKRLKRLKRIGSHLRTESFLRRGRQAFLSAAAPCIPLTGRLDNHYCVHEAGWERVQIGRIEPKHVELRTQSSANSTLLLFSFLGAREEEGRKGEGGQMGDESQAKFYLFARALV